MKAITLTGRDFTRLHAGGGGIQNEALSRATANALGIEVVAGPVEATSCGNVIVQMIATGDAEVMKKLIAYKESLKKKIIKANEDLSEYKFDFRVS